MSAGTALSRSIDTRRGGEQVRKPITRHWREWILHAILLTVGVVCIFPFIWVVGSALKTEREFFSQGLNPFPLGLPQWANFENAWVRANFSQYMVNTLFIAVSVAVLSVFIASFTAYALSRLDLPGKNGLIVLFGIIFLLPRAIPSSRPTRS